MAAPSVGVGIGTAVLMQMLVPGVVRMLNQASSFKNDPALRGRLTTEFMTTVTYGDTESAERAGQMLRTIHHHHTAVDPDTGEGYRADRPDLLLWVHATVVWSALRAAELWGPRLTDTERDRFVHEQRTAARLVGLDPATVPGSVSALDAYMQAMRLQLAFTPDAQLLVLDSMLGPKPGGSTWIERAVAGAFIDMLPAEMSKLYGFRRGWWARWTTALAARALVWFADTSVPYDKALPTLRAEARQGAFSGRGKRQNATVGRLA